MADTLCGIEKCDRRSVLPEGYPPRCAKHYLQDVDRAEAAAAQRFQDKIAALIAEKENRG